jgi:hypothetical protein
LSALSSEIKLLKSLFGFEDHSLANAAVQSKSASGELVEQQSAASNAPSTGPSDPVVESVQSGRSTFADIARRAPVAPIALQRPLRQALLTAVYDEDRQKKSRERNFILSGLPADTELTDTQFVQNVCRYELGIAADIVRCDRIGTAVSGRIQPVKVVLRSAAQAAQIISSAKQLRRSKNPFVSEKVFINADLTKAQSLAAYDERCRRRQSTNRRRRTVDLNNLTSVVIQPDVDRSTPAAGVSAAPAAGPLQALAVQHPASSSGSQFN